MYSELNKITFPESNHRGGIDEYESAAQFAESFRQLATDLSIPLNLREVGVKSNDISLLANEAMKQMRLLPNNPRLITLKDATELYQEAF